jgi:elongation factor P
MISTNDVRPGMTLDLEDGLFQIIEYQHVKPGKGKAFVKMKLKNLQSGAVLERTFRADEPVSQAIIERRPHQYLYSDDLGYHFMDGETYTQLTLSPEQVAEAAGFLKEGESVLLALYGDRAVGLDLPAAVVLTVTHAEPGVKGDRVSGATKPVTLETGLVVQVPLFVTTGNGVKVDTRSGAYITRV